MPSTCFVAPPFLTSVLYCLETWRVSALYRCVTAGEDGIAADKRLMVGEARIRPPAVVGDEGSALTVVVFRRLGSLTSLGSSADAALVRPFALTGEPARSKYSANSLSSEYLVGLALRCVSSALMRSSFFCDDSVLYENQHYVQSQAHDYFRNCARVKRRERLRGKYLREACARGESL